LSTIEKTNRKIRDKNAELDHLAHFDSLTKLPNRTLFADRLEQALAHAERKSTHVVLLGPLVPCRGFIFIAFS